MEEDKDYSELTTFTKNLVICLKVFERLNRNRGDSIQIKSITVFYNFIELANGEYRCHPVIDKNFLNPSVTEDLKIFSNVRFKNKLPSSYDGFEVSMTDKYEPAYTLPKNFHVENNFSNHEKLDAKRYMFKFLEEHGRLDLVSMFS